MASNGQNGNSERLENVPEGCILIAGAGPIGLLLAVVLSSYGVKSILLERNLTTTKYEESVPRTRQEELEYFPECRLTSFCRWPKMDLTNARSMELFRRLGLADELRAKG
jgi:FAD-dependent monooxygenase